MAVLAALLTEEQRVFIEARRVAHLATADGDGLPHVVPVCFAVHGDKIFSAVDEKPKTTAARRLKRVRNILAHPAVAIVFDRYDDNWARLGWVMAWGRAELIENGLEHDWAVTRLRTRYPQYRAMALHALPVIAIKIERLKSWGDLDERHGVA